MPCRCTCTVTYEMHFDRRCKTLDFYLLLKKMFHALKDVRFQYQYNISSQDENELSKDTSKSVRGRDCLASRDSSFDAKARNSESDQSNNRPHETPSQLPVETDSQEELPMEESVNITCTYCG